MLYKRKAYRRYRPRTMKKKLNQLSKKVSKLKMQREVKQFTTFDTAAMNPTFAGQFGLFAIGIQAGTGHNERIGREISPVLLRGRFVLNGSSTGTTSQIWQPYRIIIFQDKQGISTPTLQELLTGYSTVGGNYDTINATYNSDYVCHAGDRQNRYKILFDKRGFTSSRASNYKAATMVQFSIPGKRLDVVNYADQTSGGARAGKIWYFFVGGISATATENGEAWKYTELDYTDS